MGRVVIVGGGWAGSAAALAARRTGAEVVLIERTDMLLGTGLVGGIFRNNGRFTAAEEAIALGGGTMFEIMDATARHKQVDFPGHRHASLYNVIRIEPLVRKCLIEAGVEIHFLARMTDVVKEDRQIKKILLQDGRQIAGDVYIDATGTAGPVPNCTRYGAGCVMCIIRCPAFGGRVSLCEKAGVQELMAQKPDGSLGSMSGACKLDKASLAPQLVEELEAKGMVKIPLPPSLIKKDKLACKACQQYALDEFAEYLVLLDTGQAKLMTPNFPLEQLRQVSGFESARYVDPYAGGKGNSMRLLGIAPRDNTLRVKGIANLFCAGEKAGPYVGHTEAVVTGVLAGYNSVRLLAGLPCLELPHTLAIGDIIAHAGEEMEKGQGLRKRYTFSGSTYFTRMVELGLYTTDVKKIAARVAKQGLEKIFAQKLV